ncbi:unnamed protein product [Cochlearia groenlandica]
MNYPSNPNPSFTDYAELFKFDDLDDDLRMIMDEFSFEDHSPTLSWSTSSEKLVATEVTSPVTSSMTMSLDIDQSKDEIKIKRKRHKEDSIIHVFKTKSENHSLDDGFKWRKYGKKSIRGSPYPRHYHKCSDPKCVVTKKIDIDTTNPEYVLTTYEGIHNHPSPSVVYCDSEEFDQTLSLNTLCFSTNTTYSFSHSAP